MAACKTWNYPETETTKQFEKLFSKIDNIIINKWYQINNNPTFIYENNKFYYHMAITKRNSIGFYIDDYVLSRKGELVYITTYGYFKTKEDLMKFLNSKTM
ncbi:hypothetical protein [Konateibacter massiliensis]|uniref:hypothetical protein n=1 Tax=Konateibacter massiliensis TaxID=2002841 RepID=UPI000C155F1E|nr:hypothetical protein [Konateibacter massiliensis]